MNNHSEDSKSDLKSPEHLDGGIQLFEYERALIESFSGLMSEKHDLLQQVYRIESDMAYYQRKIQDCQRVRIEAANAKDKVVSVSPLNKLKEETGLNSEQIQKALTLMKKVE